LASFRNDTEEQPMDSWYWFVLAGLLCGVFSATFGVGSGIIMIPMLVLVFSLPQKSAQGTCLAAMVPMALAGAIRYRLNPEISMDWRIIGLLSLGAVVGAVIGASIAGWLSGASLRKLFAVIMIIVAVKMLVTPGVAKAPAGAARGGPAARLAQAGDGQESSECR
jgi:uncharacterized membrane protein YfcA